MEVPAISKLSVNSNENQNLIRAYNLIKAAAEQGARLVVLPEMWNCPYLADYFNKYAEDFDNGDSSPSFSMLSEVASCFGITIVGGSIPEWCNGRLYNTCCVFGSDGKLKAKHRKIHLFDIDIAGDISFKESDSFVAGDEPAIVETDIGRIGIGICHDMRFPELAMLYKAKGAHIIVYPGAFNMSTGELLWELVQRARAADNQVVIATCSPSRDSVGSYTIWGHSTLVSPPQNMKRRLWLLRLTILKSNLGGRAFHWRNKDEQIFTSSSICTIEGHEDVINALGSFGSISI
ncbi:hypothetical protein CRYUN_Cryun37aG0063300 [Craigia yunnanensis]